MNNEYSISEELKNIGSSLVDLPRYMPYSVPSGYFENFVTATTNTINELNIPEVVPTWNKTMPFAVPAGYFEELTGKIVDTARAENAASTFSQKTPFNAPAGYFEALPAQMLIAAKATDTVKKETTTVQLRPNVMFRSVRWAAAAVLLICIGLGSYWMLFDQQPVSSDNILASVQTDEIHDYLQGSYKLDVDRIQNNDINNLAIDTKDIVQYLDETGWDVVD